MSSERLLESVLAITGKRDLPALARALSEALGTWMRAEAVRILLLSSRTGDRAVREPDLATAVVTDLCHARILSGRELAGDPDCLECIRSQQPVSRELGAGRRRLVLPVLGAGHVASLLVLDGLRDSMLSDEALLKLTQIFGNQLLLLSRTEIDPLTGLYNRQSFDERVRQVMANGGHQGRRRRADHSAHNCFALLDIDHFKQVNDRYGHLYGDEVLLLLSRLMTRSFRHEDLLFRYGGEEFAVVLTSVAIDMATTVLERFRETVARYEFPQIGHKTVSIGVVGMTENDSVDMLVARADKALYFAKNRGRNQVRCYERLVASGELAPAEVRSGDVELF